MSPKTVMTDEEIANMSDEDFMNLSIMPDSPPPETPDDPLADKNPQDPSQDDADGNDEQDEEEENQNEALEGSEEDSASAEADEGDEGDDDPEGKDDKDSSNDEGSDPQDKDKPSDDADDSDGDAGNNQSSDSGSDDDPETKNEQNDSEEIDYKAAYLKMMAPFKANGEEIQVRSPEELVQLAQMGANYTRKMQALQPHLKVVKMLENNGVLDEAKLSFLIDLDKRDPAAIQKLIKDSGIDPMDIDTEAETTYTPKDRRVSDVEWNFTSTLEEISSKTAGRELITSINSEWDRQSKDALWNEPNIMRVLSEQKESGIYDQIFSEIKRRKTLGQLQGVAFLQAYQQIGQELTQAGKIATKTKGADQGSSSQLQNEQPSHRVIEKRTRKPRATVKDDDRAKAVSSPKPTPAAKPAKDFNPLSMSDEEFEKHAAMGKL